MPIVTVSHDEADVLQELLTGWIEQDGEARALWIGLDAALTAGGGVLRIEPLADSEVGSFLRVLGSELLDPESGEVVGALPLRVRTLFGALAEVWQGGGGKVEVQVR